jgi:hypothetical protein
VVPGSPALKQITRDADLSGKEAGQQRGAPMSNQPPDQSGQPPGWGPAPTGHRLGPAATGPATSRPDAAVPTSVPDPPTTEEPTTTTPEVSVGEVGDTLSVENADGPLGDITVTKVRSAARDPDPYIGERAKRGRFLIVTWTP